MSEKETHVEELPAQLSDREMEILRLVATGASNKEIAGQLSLSVNTIKVHLRNIFAKIGVQSRTEATMYAVRQGWVELPESVAARVAEEEGEAERGGEETGVASQFPTALAVPASERHVEPPLPWPQRIALILAVLVVVAGLAATWPRTTTAGEGERSVFNDVPGLTGSAPGTAGDSGWKLGPQMPTARGRLALSAWRDKLYAIGGITAPGGVTGAVEAYDMDKNSWSAVSSKPTPVANVAAITVNGRLIVPGGYTSNGTPTNVVELYDADNDKWSTAASLPSPVFAYALAVYDGKAYLFGGRNDRGYSGQVLVYDPAADRWSARASMPTPRGFAAAATLNNAIYVVGGYDGRREYTTCERYLPDRDKWESCAPLAVGRGGLGLASVGGRLYAVGGGWSGYLAFGEQYDPAANAWSAFATPLAGEWRNLAVVSYRTDLYAVGGWTGQSYLAVTEKFSAFPFQIYFPSP